MSATGLDELYREVILDHYRDPHGAAEEILGSVLRPRSET